MALSKIGLVDVVAITGETALAETPAGTDEFIISDAGTLKRVDAVHMFNQPFAQMFLDGNQGSFPNNSTSKVIIVLHPV